MRLIEIGYRKAETGWQRKAPNFFGASRIQMSIFPVSAFRFPVLLQELKRNLVRARLALFFALRRYF